MNLWFPWKRPRLIPPLKTCSISPSMEPYVNLAMAVLSHEDPKAAAEVIAALPLKKRYTWVASALKNALAQISKIGGHIHIATIAPGDGFEWAVPPAEDVPAFQF